MEESVADSSVLAAQRVKLCEQDIESLDLGIGNPGQRLHMSDTDDTVKEEVVVTFTSADNDIYDVNYVRRRCVEWNTDSCSISVGCMIHVKLDGTNRVFKCVDVVGMYDGMQDIVVKFLFRRVVHERQYVC